MGQSLHPGHPRPGGGGGIAGARKQRSRSLARRPGRSQTRPAHEGCHVVSAAERPDVSGRRPQGDGKLLSLHLLLPGPRLCHGVDKKPSRYHGHLRVRCLRARPPDGQRPVASCAHEALIRLSLRMAEPLDLIVIGTGTAGSGPTYRCRRAGWRVAVVDELPYGGTCALRGCDPKKVLVGAAELVDWHRRMQGRGVSGDAHVSWAELIPFQRTFTDPVPADPEKAFPEAGIATYHGPARFVSPERLSVDGQVVEARHFVVAAGAKPRHLGIPGEGHLLTSTAFLELDQLPPRIAFLGAGYISFEFAHISRRAGAQVTIIGRGRPRQHFDEDLVTRLAEDTPSLGIAVQGESEVTAIEKRGGGDGMRVHSQGRIETVDADAVVHGGGRVPDTEGLDLGAANVATVPNGGGHVNEFLQSVSKPRVHAAGEGAASSRQRPPT